jgi:hypothetical protein
MDLDTVKVDITAVVQCVAEASDVALRNQALTLLTAISRVSPDLVLKHVIDILTAIGASTITQVKKLLSPCTQISFMSVYSSVMGFFTSFIKHYLTSWDANRMTTIHMR